MVVALNVKIWAIFSTDGGKRMAVELGITFLGAIPFDPLFVSRLVFELQVQSGNRLG